MSLARNATASQSPTQTNGYERHQTRPDAALTSWLSSTTQPSKPHSKPKVNTCLATSNKNSTTSSNVAVWSMVSCGFAARIVITSVWSPSAVKRRGFCPSCGARRMAESAALLIDEVFPKEPIRQWVLSFPFQLRFWLARHPQLMGQVLSIVYRTLSTHLIKKAGYTKASAQTGSVTLIQRFGSALNLNVHYHMLFLDGVYAEDDYGKQRFHRVKAPTYDELNTLAHTLSHRIARCMEKRGILERDAENTWLTLEEGEDDTLTQLHGASVTYRIAVGPQPRAQSLHPANLARA
ncbi:putative transposase [Escherichia coli]|nr:putative transposase [Escherichia coli]